MAYVTRSGFVEGVHHGSASVLDADGVELISLGQPAAPMLPRSSLKPVQLVAMLRAGLVLTGPLLALGTASHSGESFHRDGVRRILDGAGIGEQALRNAADLPFGAGERLRWQGLSRPASRLAQNCSGKHAAMLATCIVNGWPTDEYLEPEHPLQRLIRDTVAEFADEPVAATAVDGCGAPAFAISLTGLARAFGRLATAPPHTPEGLVAAAIRDYPQWLGGTGREVTELIRVVPGLVAKDGAEAVYAAALPDGRAIALKIADGGERARQVVIVALLGRLGLRGPALAALAQRPILGGGAEVGAVIAADF